MKQFFNVVPAVPLKAEQTGLSNSILIDLMLKHGTYLVPTLLAPLAVLEAGEKGGMPEYGIRKSREVIEIHSESISRAHLTTSQGKRIGYILLPTFGDDSVDDQVGEALRALTAPRGGWMG